MGRPTNTRVSRLHPSPRFRDKIRLLCFRRGSQDATWAAEFHLDGKWTPRGGVSLGTEDWDEACEMARDKYAVAATGQRVARPYAITFAEKAKVANPFRLYGERAIVKLRARASEQTVGGKAHNFEQLARRIERDLIPQWGDTDITKLTEHALNDWVQDVYRVEDVNATVARYGRQAERQTRQKVLKKAGKTTLGNLDWALLKVWDEAAAAKVVERRTRPKIDKGLGGDSEPRAFIDAAGVQAVADMMTDAWVASPDDHAPDLKRSFRCYTAMIAGTGIRPGLEAKRVRIGDVKIRPGAITIYVAKKQGKHRDGRTVVVYEGGPRDDKTHPEFLIRRLLIEQSAWRIGNGATKQDYLFPWPATGQPPMYRDVLATVLTAADALTDPMTGERRVAYSFRHFFATRLIELGYSVPFIAAWLGTSSEMVERNYNRFLVEHEADRVSGVLPFVDPMPDPWRTPEDDRLDEMADR